MRNYVKMMKYPGYIFEARPCSHHPLRMIEIWIPKHVTNFAEGAWVCQYLMEVIEYGRETQ